MEKDNGVSQAALSVARILDRLKPGEYVVDLIKPGKGKEHYWSVAINKQVQIDRRVIGKGEVVKN